MEGKPDEQFVYLIGLVVRRGDCEDRHSFCGRRAAHLRGDAGSPGRSSGRAGLQLRRLRADFHQAHARGAQSKKFIDRVLGRLVNALSIIYAHFYFPTYSNDLKEIGAVLGCTWSDDQASGLQSVVWRLRWERSLDERWKDRLLQ